MNRQIVLSSELFIRLARPRRREKKAGLMCAKFFERLDHSTREHIFGIVVLLNGPQRGDDLLLRIAPPFFRLPPLGSKPTSNLSVEEVEPMLLYPRVHRFYLVSAQQAAGECRGYRQGQREPGRPLANCSKGLDSGIRARKRVASPPVTNGATTGIHVT